MAAEKEQRTLLQRSSRQHWRVQTVPLAFAKLELKILMSDYHPDRHDFVTNVVMSVGDGPVILFTLVPVHAQYSVVFLHQIIPMNELALQTQ